jgi:hypothetical protein
MKGSRGFVRGRVLTALGVLSLASTAFAIPVDLSDGNPATTDAWATICQGSFTVSSSVDGSFDTGVNGWAIYPTAGPIGSETAVYKAVTDISNPAGTRLTFDLYSLHSNPGHNLGRFRISVTNDDRSLYGQGVECGNPSPEGTAMWTVLDPISADSLNGQTLTIQGDGSILASGTNPASDLVTVIAETSISGITGFRLEVLQDPSLPSSGPGRFSNGNFVLTELVVDQEAFGAVAVPTVGTWTIAVMCLLMLGTGSLVLRRSVSRAVSSISSSDDRPHGCPSMVHSGCTRSPQTV